MNTGFEDYTTLEPKHSASVVPAVSVEQFRIV